MERLMQQIFNMERGVGMMKSIKRGIAVFLSVLLMVPAQPAIAAEFVSTDFFEENVFHKKAENVENEAKEDLGEAVSENKGDFTELQKASSSDADKPSEPSEPPETAGKASPDSAKKTGNKAEDEVIFNTGNYTFHVVSREDFFGRELGDGCFEDDGSYVIEIPEENPFFPYEVQFTYDGETASEWFLNPEDTVEIGGHRFSVSAYFDNTMLTQMTMNIAGKSVVVYPKKKNFTDHGVMPMSLLPLKERRLNVDLSGFTPVELTMVSFDQIFTGTEAIESGDQVVWTYRNGRDDYTVSMSGDRIDLSYDFTYSTTATWEMIVGSDDQLDGNNIRYLVDLKKTDAKNWLIPHIYMEDKEGKRNRIDVIDYGLNNHHGNYDPAPNHYFNSFMTYIPGKSIKDGDKAYMSFEINNEIFPSAHYDHLKVYNEEFRSLSQIGPVTDITDEILYMDMSTSGAGTLIEVGGRQSLNITIVAFDSSGNEIGCLPLNLFFLEGGDTLDFSLFSKSNNGRIKVDNSYNYKYASDYNDVDIKLKYGYPANNEYFLFMKYHNNINSQFDVEAVYQGLYFSVSEAEEAGAADIKDILLSSDYSNGGFSGDFSRGMEFTVFLAGNDGYSVISYRYCFTTREWIESLDGDTSVSFSGLKDKNGNQIPSYAIDAEEDSYGEYNYLTILVGEDTDLTALAPVFEVYDGLNLYTDGNSSPEVSGVSIHDFSDDAVQYTASAENGVNAKNYWLQVKKASRNGETLYINSLADENVETITKNGIIYSNREVLLDEYHNDIHDILLANISVNEIPNLSVELTSEELELDDYWNLKGLHSLAGFSTVDKAADYGELPNLAKIRLKAKRELEFNKGLSVSGKLTIKSGSTPLIVLTLTGTIGAPGIITEEIPKAVKYVPYGTMIQNNNKYSWNSPFYYIESGTLPAGMEVRSNGELYGVPLESGTYTFSVRMRNNSGLSDSVRTYSMTVDENTDDNVERATDPGYILMQRINDINLSSSDDQTVVSKGVYEEFTGVYLDGVKLKSGEDYTSESGSTRITIRNQTLRAHNNPGIHTLGIEFRTKDTNILKRAAQNYKVVEKQEEGGNDNGSDSGSSDNGGSGNDSGSGGNGNSGGNSGVGNRSSKINSYGKGEGHWQQDENGWKWIYEDGSFASGYMIKLADESQAVQAAWEKVNGSWYAFDSDGYLFAGWVYDYQLNSWYSMTVESGMRTGWYYDDQDHCIYYLDQETGALVTGWRRIDNSWYYFTETSLGATWYFDEEHGVWRYDSSSRNKPYGSMYHNEKTPDGYFVEEHGVWRD